MALESILICNLVEARRQMENLPLTVMRNVPERKADAVRRRLRELGATAIVRPTSDQPTAGRR
jgi:ribosomal protein L7/L12